MSPKKILKASLAALAITAAGAASASTVLGTITHNYGNGVGDVAPTAGAACGLTANYVTVKDAACNGQRFVDVFNFSGLGYKSIDSFTLTLSFDGAGAIAEDWFVRPATGTAASADFWTTGVLNGYRNFEFWDTTIIGNTERTFTFTASSLDLFSAIVKSGHFDLWFAEESIGSDSFNLASAKLQVNGTVPEPSGLALAAVALLSLGVAARRRGRR
ncbi:hypothetical protein [Roseateles violae]|uniref:PEP-CTERM protein-sorting domain-containing protein n=1 Tax=Roseateles violae TaxID=3058042 RepID=A0ABT8DNT3_9BURK|nr:hypothetical protein [Pelomonas sp. PFR6]MDN3919656.1 hypothetical protein [Pelomonas sp. PFR6]